VHESSAVLSLSTISIDIQHRTGRYPLPRYPSPIGMEGAGIIDAIGDEVHAFKPGDRVVYSSMPIGA